MKFNQDTLIRHIGKLDRAALERFARSVVWSLYAETYLEEEGLLSPVEVITLGLKDGDVYFDTAKEWSHDTTANVRDDIENAGLIPEETT